MTWLDSSCLMDRGTKVCWVVKLTLVQKLLNTQWPTYLLRHDQVGARSSAERRSVHYSVNSFGHADSPDHDSPHDCNIAITFEPLLPAVTHPQ